MLWVGLAVVLLFEAAYRWGVIDFYRNELQAFNDREMLEDAGGRKTILLCGDSFSAHQAVIKTQFANQLPGYRVINAAVPGTGIMQTTVLAPTRIRHFQPQIFIYQLYVGNDLFDISHPLNSQTLSIWRNAYWWVADRLRGVAYLNYRSGQWANAWKTAVNPSYDPTAIKTFSPEQYHPREKLLLRAEPALIENSACLKGGRADDMEILLEKLDRVIAQLPKGCRVYLLVIPHCAQVNDHYLERFRQLGARFSDSTRLQQSHFPFIEVLDRHFAEKHQVQTLNTLLPLRAFDLPGNRLYFANDPHLNDRGQETIWRFVASRLSADLHNHAE